MSDEPKEHEIPHNPGAQAGDIVTADGQVGRVLGIEGSDVTILPFREKPDYLPTVAFIATGEIKVMQKYFERNRDANEPER